MAVPLRWQATGEAVLAAWPAASPLVVLWSGGGQGEGRARWRVFAVPAGVWRADGKGGSLMPAAPHYRGNMRAHNPAEAPPFLSGWIGVIRYEAGRVIEPAAGLARSGRRGAGAPLAEWLECPAAYVQDGASGEWWFVGDPARAGALPWGLGDGDGPEARGTAAPAFGVRGLVSTTGREAFERSVARAVEYIHAGDCFQVNLAHHLVGRFDGSSRGAFAAALGVEPWYGAYLELPGDGAGGTGGTGGTGPRRAVVSLSPELFLEVDGQTRKVVTRPIKGTRRVGPRSVAELGASAKDHAELAMIIDLMRNDLGRVCRIGSVRVDEARAIERHAGTLDHGVATVSGVLRNDAGLDELIAAAFPPGSVTGAPKVRAMQIIDELEAAPRGVYCGCVGFISACGNAAFNVAIRTATIEQRGGPPTAGHEFTDATIDLPVGAGIVAESDPAREWQETLDKAEAIKRTLLNGPC